MYYNGFHLHHALRCLRAGYRDNAVSWMWRDLGEICSSDKECPHPDTLEEEDGMIRYRTCLDIVMERTENQDGAGI